MSNLGGRESLEIAVTLRQSIELLIIEYQRGHTSYEERAHYLVFEKVWGCGGGAPCPSDVNRALVRYKRLKNV